MRFMQGLLLGSTTVIVDLQFQRACILIFNATRFYRQVKVGELDIRDWIIGIDASKILRIDHHPRINRYLYDFTFKRGEA